LPLEKVTEEVDSTMSSIASCSEQFGNAVDHKISSSFHRVGCFVGARPRLTILLTIVFTMVFGVGYTMWTTENRPEVRIDRIK
jgi:hypothetical protein